MYLYIAHFEHTHSTSNSTIDQNVDVGSSIVYYIILYLDNQVVFIHLVVLSFLYMCEDNSKKFVRV